MESVLIVEDEPSVRTTLKEWLLGAKLDIQVFVAIDAASALELSSKQSIDLAILDWNLGAGLNGLQLLEDLHEFQPDVVAILVTGFAHQATPLDALRLGVRDYLDKSVDLSRERFIESVRKQLERIRPLKRERLIQTRLQRFRTLVAEALPHLEASRTVNRSNIVDASAFPILLQFARDLTGASDGLLVVLHLASGQDSSVQLTFYDHTGQVIADEPQVNFRDSLAAAIQSLTPACLVGPLNADSAVKSVQFTPRESRHRFVLGTSLFGTSEMSVILELFDKQTAGEISPFSIEDQELLQAFRPVAALVLNTLFGEHSTQRLLYEALHSILKESDEFVGTLGEARNRNAGKVSLEKTMMDQDEISAADIDQWVSTLQRLTRCYGPGTVNHVTQVLQQLEVMLSDLTGPHPT